nr:hypothetical protein CFP56_66511 [Quercus suber]
MHEGMLSSSARGDDHCLLYPGPDAGRCCRAAPSVETPRHSIGQRRNPGTTTSPASPYMFLDFSYVEMVTDDTSSTP